MSIMAKTPSGYKKIGSAYLGERPVDKVFNANGDVVYALQRELTGVPPLFFKGKEQSELLNYRIYGDTVDGNSVGDLVESGEHTGEYVVPVTVEGKNLFNENSLISPIFVRDHYLSWYFDDEHYLLATDKSIDDRPWSYDYSQINIALSSGTYTIQLSGVAASNQFAGIYITNSNKDKICSENISGKTSSVMTFTLNTPETIAIEIKVFDGKYRIMLVEGSTPLPYEPYHAPITTPIYLPEPIKMVGDEAEYVDYKEQKLHRVRKNLFYITKFTNNNTQSTAQGVNFSIIDNEVYANGTPTGMYPQACGFDYVLTEGETYAVTLYIEGEYTGLPYIYCTTTYDSAGNYQKVPPNVRTIFTALPDTRIIFVAQGTGESFNIKYKLLITKVTIEDDTYEPYIENVDLDVTIPALPTIKGTNEMSVGTEVQPSRMDIKGRIKSLT